MEQFLSVSDSLAYKDEKSLPSYFSNGEDIREYLRGTPLDKLKSAMKIIKVKWPEINGEHVRILWKKEHPDYRGEFPPLGYGMRSIDIEMIPYRYKFFNSERDEFIKKIEKIGDFYALTEGILIKPKIRKVIYHQGMELGDQEYGAVERVGRGHVDPFTKGIIDIDIDAGRIIEYAKNFKNFDKFNPQLFYDAMTTKARDDDSADLIRYRRLIKRYQ